MCAQKEGLPMNEQKKLCNLYGKRRKIWNLPPKCITNGNILIIYIAHL